MTTSSETVNMPHISPRYLWGPDSVNFGLTKLHLLHCPKVTRDPKQERQFQESFGQKHYFKLWLDIKNSERHLRSNRHKSISINIQHKEGIWNEWVKPFGNNEITEIIKEGNFGAKWKKNSNNEVKGIITWIPFCEKTFQVTHSNFENSKTLIPLLCKYDWICPTPERSVNVCCG